MKAALRADHTVSCDARPSVASAYLEVGQNASPQGQVLGQMVGFAGLVNFDFHAAVSIALPPELVHDGNRI